MNALCWNCRGLGNAPAIWELKAIVRGSHVDCQMLQETKIEMIALQCILRSMGFNSCVHVPPIETAGVLCIAWKDNLDLELIFMSKHAISCVVYQGTITLPWLILGVYGPHNKAAKMNFWGLIGVIASRFRGPCLILGDFNDVLHSS